ncbi:hypothetical protein [Actinomadura kijaniata]|uniref:hypothetical protein n=1 Tax=Actinomadura kijaniata TaxID=46161 RepID=UPI003F5376E3
MLLEDTSNGNRDFFVLERTADSAAQTYFPVVGGCSGFVLEYRDGGPDSHFGAECDDLRRAHQVVTGWAFERDGWKGGLPWKRACL